MALDGEGPLAGCLVGLTKGAFDFAKDKPLKLISGSYLLALLKDHAGIEATIRSTGRWKNPIKPPP